MSSSPAGVCSRNVVSLRSASTVPLKICPSSSCAAAADALEARGAICGAAIGVMIWTGCRQTLLAARKGVVNQSSSVVQVSFVATNSSRWRRCRRSTNIRVNIEGWKLCMPGRVGGKVALIVGAGCIGPGWGNGRAAAVLFAREGAKVFAVDKDADAMTETVARVGNDGEIATHVCDVLDDKQVAAMTETCRKKFGGNIDILINNVGGSAAGGAADVTAEG